MGSRGTNSEVGVGSKSRPRLIIDGKQIYQDSRCRIRAKVRKERSG